MSKERLQTNESMEKQRKTVLTVERLSVSKGINLVLDNISFTILEGEHIALIGPNGAGKTTLLETIIGDELPDSGKVLIPRGVSLAYVPQSVENVFPRNQDGTVVDYFYASRGLDIVRRRMEEIGELLGEKANQSDVLLEEYGALQTVYEHRGGYTLETEAQMVMAGVGLSDEITLNSSVYDLSGGEKTKLFLAQALLSDADILLLDEPSNHLDPESVAWLADFLKKYRGAVLVVSHRPDLLDQVVGKIFELDGQNIRTYLGNYSDCISKKDKREAEEAKRTKRTEAEIERLSEMVDRFRAGVRAKTAKDRQKKLDKIIGNSPTKKAKRKAVRAVFEIEVQSGLGVLEIIGLQKSYGEKVLDYSGIELNVQRGEKVGITGPVGAGKSTLLKIIAGTITPDSGEVKLGYHVDVGYYSQEMEDLSPENSVLDEVVAISTGKSIQQLRTFLGSFLFSNDDVFKKVEVLSFGERSRLVLAKLALMKHNFLVLDEPSNHLDVVTRNLIADKLKEYQGTVLVVSHDGEFMDRVGLTRTIRLPDGKMERG